ncbi:MAG: trigger factor [Fusobacteria bacterium]|nr:trigger factor [Fusobacteriota bacterium]
MANKIISKENNIVSVEITVEAEVVEKAYKQASKSLSEKVSIPGFRKGKVPADILEKHVGEGSIIEETVDIILPEEYGKTIFENDLQPIDRPKVDIIEFDKKGPAVFKVEIQVVPEGVLGDYSGLNLERKMITLDENYVASELEAMRTKTAKVEITEDPAAEGDTVVIDFEGYIGEKQFDGGTGQDYPLELGSKTFIPGFEEQLIGVKAGENIDVNVKFPENYHAEDLKGQDSVFKVTIKEVKKRILSKLNDDFAKEVSDFDTLEELKEDIRKSLKNQKQEQADNALRTQALDLAINKIEVEIPEIMIKERTDQFMKDIQGDLQQQGMELDKYFELTGMTEEKVREEYRHNAIKHIKRDILLDAVAANEKLVITAEDFDQEITAMSQIYGQPKEMLDGYFKSPENLKMLDKGLKREKALQRIIELANINEVAEEKVEVSDSKIKED